MDQDRIAVDSTHYAFESGERPARNSDFASNARRKPQMHVSTFHGIHSAGEPVANEPVG
jgi:hypothetical protein